MKKSIHPERFNSLTIWFSEHYGIILIFLAPIVLFGPMLLSGRVLFWGTPIMQFVPWREFAKESLLHGHLPLWNPWLGMGSPLIANYQSAIFYPPNWILFLTGSAWGHGLVVMLHVFWTGLGMLYFVKQLGLSKLSQVVAGLSFSLSGYVISRSGFLSINATVAWLPWILLFADRLVLTQSIQGSAKRFIKPIILLGLVIGLQWLAGHAQTSWYCFILTLIWVCWRGFSLGGGKGIGKAILGLGAASLIAFLLSAVQLLPTVEYLIHSHRASGVEREIGLDYSFWPWRFLGLLMPNIFGNPATGDYWGYANYWEDAIYIGILPLVLAFFAIIRGIKGNNYSGLIKLLLGLSVVTSLLALGKNTPIFLFLYENVPTFNLFQAPTRWMIILVFSLSLLAAIGAEFWQKKELLRLFWVRLGTVGAAAAGIIALVGARFLSDIKESFAPAIAFASLWFMFSGMIAWRRRIQPASFWPFLIALFICIDLLWATYRLNPTIPLEKMMGKGKLVTQISSDHRIYMPEELEEKIKYEWTHRFDTYFPDVDWHLIRDTGLPNTAMLDHISSANNFDPILPERYVTWMDTLELTSSEKYIQMQSMMDIGWETTLYSEEEYDVGYTEVPDPHRILFVGNVIWANTSEEALETILASDFNPNEAVVLEGIPIRSDITNPSGSTYSILKNDNPNKLQIEVVTTSDCWLVVSDTWFPGWSAKIDGNNAELYRANFLFRAIQLPPGEHNVEFIYRPISFLLGGSLSLLSWMGLGAVLWIIKRK